MHWRNFIFILAMLIGVPVMSKLMGIRDTIMVAIGAIAHASGRVIFVLAEIPELFYVGNKKLQLFINIMQQLT